MSTLINGQESVMPMAMSNPLWVRVRHQGYVFSRRDALEFGTSDEQLRAWHTCGDVLRGAQGVYYIPDSSPPGPGNDCERRKLRAVLLALGDAFFATHQSALLAWGLPVYPLHSVQDVHVGRQGTRHWSRRPGVHLHRTPSQVSVTTADGIRTVNAADAIAGVGARMGIEAAVVAADAALHRGLISAAELAVSIAAMHGVHGSAQLRALLDLVDARSESPGESRLRLIFRAAGVAVTPQAVIRDDAQGFVARVDLLVDNSTAILEFDGMLKYRGLANSEALVHEKRRELALHRLGYQVVRVVWDDLDEPEGVLKLLTTATGLRAPSGVR